jgi:hypothetical protein
MLDSERLHPQRRAAGRKDAEKMLRDTTWTLAAHRVCKSKAKETRSCLTKVPTPPMTP